MTKRTKSPLVLAVVLLAIGFVVIAASADLSPAVASQDASTSIAAVHSPMTSGSAEGSVFPAPVAMVLGVVGLSVIGFRLRKYA